MDNTDIIKQVISKLKTMLHLQAGSTCFVSSSDIKESVGLLNKLQPEPDFYQPGDLVILSDEGPYYLGYYVENGEHGPDNPVIRSDGDEYILGDSEELLGKVIIQKPGQEFLEVIKHDGGEYPGHLDDFVCYWRPDRKLPNGNCLAYAVEWSNVEKYLVLRNGGSDA